GDVWIRDGRLLPIEAATGQGHRRSFTLSLRPRRDAPGAFVRVTSPLGTFDLSDGRKAAAFLRARDELDAVRVYGDLRSLDSAPTVVLFQVAVDLPLPRPVAAAHDRYHLALQTATTAADYLAARLHGARPRPPAHLAARGMSLAELRQAL